MPDYSVSEVGQVLAQAIEQQQPYAAMRSEGPLFPDAAQEPSYNDTQSRIYREPRFNIPEATCQPRSAQPFPYNSWEVMSNVEKLDRLREDINGLKGTLDRLESRFEAMIRAFEQHQHSPNGGPLLVQYSRDRLY